MKNKNFKRMENGIKKLSEKISPLNAEQLKRIANSLRRMNETFDSKEDLKKSVAEYEKNGFKVYYNL